MFSIKEEPERCLKCKVPQCSKHCPINTPIPEVMRLYMDGKAKEAGRLLFENNPMSAITSIVCPHERNCYGHCVLGIKGIPISFYSVEQYVSRLYLETFEAPEIKKNGIRIAVVGSGPAGLTMSIFLALKGFDITLFEAKSDIGGVLRYGIPDFRLPKEILELYKRVLKELGVVFRPNVSVGTEILFEDLFTDGYKAIFMAQGTGKPNRFGLIGETLGNVHYAINYLRSPEAHDLGKRVVVVGTGNVAMDAARSCIRKNHCEVKILNLGDRDEITCDREEAEYAELDGAEFVHNVMVVRIMDNAVRCVKSFSKTDENGQIYFEEEVIGEYFDIPTDSVILAIGQGPGAELQYGDRNLVNERGYIKADENGVTDIPGVFAAGDIVTGPKTVVEAAAFAMKVGKKIIEYVTG